MSILLLEFALPHFLFLVSRGVWGPWRSETGFTETPVGTKAAARTLFSDCGPSRDVLLPTPCHTSITLYYVIGRSTRGDAVGGRRWATLTREQSVDDGRRLRQSLRPPTAPQSRGNETVAVAGLSRRALVNPCWSSMTSCNIAQS